MQIEYLQGESALRNSGARLNEGEAFLVIDDKPVKQEIIDRFDMRVYYVGERPTGVIAKLIVNLYKISVEGMDKFNEHVPGLRFTDIDDADSYIELALIPSKVHEWNGSITEDWYISERLNDEMYCRPSKKYKDKMQRGNRKWGEQELNQDQAN